MSRILITGATGFLGSYFFRFLQDKGYETYGTSLTRGSDRIKLCNLENLSHVKSVMGDVKPDVVIHCAAIAGVTSYQSGKYYMTNVIGAENVIQTAVSVGAKRFIHISTAGVYGNQDSELLIETLCPKPVHHYGMSKFCSERLVLNYKNDINISIVRPFNIIGKGQNNTFVVPKLVNAFKNGEKSIKLGNIDVYRDYIDVRDSVRFVYNMIENPDSYNQTVNLCAGRATSIRDLLQELQALTGHEVKVSVASEFVRKNEVWRLLGDSSKLKSLIGENFNILPIRDTLKNMLQS